MTAPTAPARVMVEVSGTESLWLLEGAAQGLLIRSHRDQAVVRPAVHVLAYGRLVVRAPVQSDLVAGRPTLTYQVQEVRMPAATGWSVTVTGPAEAVTDPDEAAHYRRTLPGWAYGPHDTVLRIQPQTVTGYRLGKTTSR
ncbi:pyridoxamine 5'-phosphate oxidase family protein [Streptomyces sp. NPDC005828]|uniref:pyridoxamine 5'-phosphate oxidase family protein n=1 Tax=Streptomyces sp. NPDC005828 TaxID=3157071 RepID=UPI0033D2B46B